MKVSKLKLQKLRNRHNANNQTDRSWHMQSSRNAIVSQLPHHTHCPSACAALSSTFPGIQLPVYTRTHTGARPPCHKPTSFRWGLNTRCLARMPARLSTSWAHVIPCSTSAGARPSPPPSSHLHLTMIKKQAGAHASVGLAPAARTTWTRPLTTYSATCALGAAFARWAPHGACPCTLETRGTPSGGTHRAFRSAARSSRLHGAARKAVRARCSTPGRAASGSVRGSPPHGASR